MLAAEARSAVIRSKKIPSDSISSSLSLFFLVQDWGVFCLLVDKCFCSLFFAPFFHLFCFVLLFADYVSETSRHIDGMLKNFSRQNNESRIEKEYGSKRSLHDSRAKNSTLSSNRGMLMDLFFILMLYTLIQLGSSVFSLSLSNHGFCMLVLAFYLFRSCAICFCSSTSGKKYRKLCYVFWG